MQNGVKAVLVKKGKFNFHCPLNASFEKTFVIVTLLIISFRTLIVFFLSPQALSSFLFPSLCMEWLYPFAYNISEAATETIFENICSFLSGAPFSGFFQEALCVHRTDANFPGRFVCSLNRYKFSRRTWSSSPIFQEHRFSHWTDTDFPGTIF